MSIHLVLYSNNEPYNTTKRITIESITKYTKKPIIIHDYNLESIKLLDWFQNIKDLPSIHKDGRRDGYYNCWKAFITKDVYDMMNNDDILYYVDSSQYFISGFTENIDKLCDIVNEKGFIAGSVSNDVTNNTINCCNNLSIWNKIIQNNDNNNYLEKMHVLNSWFILKKLEKNNQFINDWVYYSIYKDDELHEPLVTYHHTADQSIFNILVIKYNLFVFYHENIIHNDNKNKNLVLNIINNTNNANDYFIHL